MKLLVISEMGCGPPWHGNRIRLRALLNELKLLGLEIHFAGVNISELEKSSTVPIVDKWIHDFLKKKKYGLKTYIRLALQPYFYKRIFSRIFHSNIAELDTEVEPEWIAEALELQASQNYDVVLVEYVFHSALLEAFPDGCTKIIDTHDVFADRNKILEANGIPDLWFSISSKAELYGLMRAHKIIAIQNREAEYFRNLLSERDRVVVVGHIIPAESPVFPADDSLVIGYFGSDSSINEMCLKWFIDNVWNYFIQHEKNAKFIIAGGISRRFESSGHIKVNGECNNPSDFYARIHVAINPMLFGTGLKIKTIEALSFAKPVIATSKACDGIENYIGKGVYLSDTSEEFIKTLVFFSLNHQEISKSGLRAIEELKSENIKYRNELRSIFKVYD